MQSKHNLRYDKDLAQLAMTIDSNIRAIAEYPDFAYANDIGLVMADQTKSPIYEMPPMVMELLAAMFMFGGGSTVWNEIQAKGISWKHAHPGVPDRYNEFRNGKCIHF